MYYPGSEKKRLNKEVELERQINEGDVTIAVKAFTIVLPLKFKIWLCMINTCHFTCHFEVQAFYSVS